MWKFSARYSLKSPFDAGMVFISFLFWTLLSLPGTASPAPADPLVIEHQKKTEILVTATRIKNNELLSFPGSLTLIDAETISDRQALNLHEILDSASSIHAVRSGPFGSAGSLFLRGTDSDHTLILLDGTRLNSPATPSGQFNSGIWGGSTYQRVEILSGPLSSLYGSDAMGGVINLIPHGLEEGTQPLQANQLAAGFGSHQTRHAAFRISGGEKASRFGLNASHYRTEGFNAVPSRFSLSGDEKDGAQSSQVTASASRAFGSNLRGQLLLHHHASKNEFDDFAGGPSGFQRADDPDLQTDRDDLTLLRAGLNLDPGAWSNQLRVGHIHTHRLESNGAAPTGDEKGKRSFLDWQSERQLSWSDEQTLQLIFGGQWEQEKIDIPISFNHPFSQTETHFGLFSMLDWKIGEKFRLLSAVRSDEYESFGSEVTYNIGLSYQPGSSGIWLYANSGTGFNAPTLTEQFGVSAFNQGNPNLAAEKGNMQEIGLRIEPRNIADMPTSGTISLYRSDINNLIQYGFASLRNENLGKAEIKGLELQWRLSADPGEGSPLFGKLSCNIAMSKRRISTIIPVYCAALSIEGRYLRKSTLQQSLAYPPNGIMWGKVLM